MLTSGRRISYGAECIRGSPRAAPAAVDFLQHLLSAKCRIFGPDERQNAADDRGCPRGLGTRADVGMADVDRAGRRVSRVTVVVDLVPPDAVFALRRRYGCDSTQPRWKHDVHSAFKRRTPIWKVSAWRDEQPIGVVVPGPDLVLDRSVSRAGCAETEDDQLRPGRGVRDPETGLG